MGFFLGVFHLYMVEKNADFQLSHLAQLINNNFVLSPVNESCQI